MKVILASASSRRYGILKNYGYSVTVAPSNYCEDINGSLYSDSLLLNCAYQKALEIKEKLGDEILIISADTVVVNDGIILGKPKDKQEAIECLSNLSDKTHFVATGICLMYKNQVLKDSAKTYVTFRKLTQKEILDYIITKQPYDKAGSYGIQDEDFDFAIKIDGDLDNVIGFPMKLFKSLLNNLR